VVAAPARQLERPADHPFDFGDGVFAFVGGGVRGARLGAEVGTAGQLANEQYVDIFQLLVLQRRQLGQRRMHLQRTQVGVDAQCGAQRQQTLFGTYRCVRIGPLRPADRAEHHGIGLLARGQRGRWQRGAGGVDGGATDQLFVEAEDVLVAAGDGFQDSHCRSSDFGADAIAGQSDDVGFHAAFSNVFS
jgi:hypothetical protein